MKVQCPCGAKFAFDITADMAHRRVDFACPTCGVDLSDALISPAPVRAKGPHPRTRSRAKRASAHREPWRETLSQAPWRDRDREMLYLLQTDLSEMHGAVRLCLFTALQSQSGVPRRFGASLRKPAVRGRSADLAEGRANYCGCLRAGCCGSRTLILVCLVWIRAEGSIFLTV